jgi:signal transduction histidine kinase
MKKSVNGRLVKWFMVLCCLLLTMRGSSQSALMKLYFIHHAQDTAQILQGINAGVTLQWSQPDSAIQVLTGVLAHSQQVHYTDGAAFALLNMAHAAVAKADYVQSYRYYAQARPYCLYPQFNKALPAMYYSDIATTYLHQGKYELAGWHYFEALREMSNKGLLESDNVLLIYTNMAFMQTSLGQNEQALYYLAAAENIARKSNRTEQLPFILNNKGEALAGLDFTDSAMACYQEGLHLVRNTTRLSPGRKTEIHQSLNNSIGSLLLKTGHTEASIPYFTEAIALSNQTNPYFSRIFPHYYLGQVYFRKNQYQKALSHLLPALDTANRLGFKESMLGALHTLADLYQAMGNYRSANTVLNRYIALKDSMLNKEKTAAVNRYELKFRTAQKDKEIAEKQLLISQQEGRITRQTKWIWVASMSASLLTVLSLLLWILYRNNQHKQRLQQQTIVSMQQEQELRKQEEDIKVMQALIKGEEKERMRLARDIHDGIGGMIAAARMHVSTLQNRTTSQVAADDFTAVMHLLQETSSEIRKTAHNLMPDTLLQHNLQEALQLFCNHINAGNRTQFDLQVYEPLPKLSQSVTLSLYRVIQELMQNILKHAGATLATIQISQRHDKLCLTMEDNGRGFNPDAITEGTGLRNIRSRVEAMQGYLAIESAPDRGTITTIELDFSILQQLSHDDTYSHSR